MPTFDLVINLQLKRITSKQIVRVKAFQKMILLKNYIAGGPE